jgi:hypothetical protein
VPRLIRLKNQRTAYFFALHNNFAVSDSKSIEKQPSALPRISAVGAFSLIQKGYFRASDLACRL